MSSIKRLKMKTLTINNYTFKYEIFSDVSELDGVYYWTNFYQGEEVITRKKFWLFGEKITETKPKLVFKINENIESEKFTKEDIRAMILRKVQLMERKSEIERGEII